MTKALTARAGALWIQFGGPTSPTYYLGCHDLGDITIPIRGGIELSQCFSPTGKGWDTVAVRETAPGTVGFSIDNLMTKARDLLEDLSCPFTLFVLARDCGRADAFDNYVRGLALENCYITNHKYAGLVARTEDKEQTHSVDIVATPDDIYKIQQLSITRQATATILAVSDIAFNPDDRCLTDCGAALGRGDQAITGSIAAAAAAASYKSTNQGITWAAWGTQPFAVTIANMSVARFYVARATERWLVASGFKAGTQALVGISDDGGATWTTVNIGPAVGYGAVYGRSLFALDSKHIWLGSKLGYIFFSGDGGLTWTTQEAGAITVNGYTEIHFADELNGYAVCDTAGIVAKTNNGGLTWTACTVPAVIALYTVQCIDANRAFVGGASGALYYTSDGGVTWTAITSFVGAGAGTVRGLSMAKDGDLFGFMAYDTAGPVGSVKRTKDGGATWENIVTPANVGLLGCRTVDESTCWVYGNVAAATGFIAKVRAA
jgi:photosystem II stability/assembly factor-like uncharacterized protein